LTWRTNPFWASATEGRHMGAPFPVLLRTQVGGRRCNRALRRTKSL